MPTSRDRGGAEVAEMVGEFAVELIGALAIYQVVWKYFNTLIAGWLYQTVPDEY